MKKALGILLVITLIVSALAVTPVFAADNGSTYTVVSGDTFAKIAAKYGLSVDALAKLNPQVKDINLIYVGNKINVKGSATASVATGGKLYQGLGMVANYRDRSSATTTPPYNHASDNMNVTSASVVFDEAGKIVDIKWDVLEITPAEFKWAADGAAAPAEYAAAQKDGFEWETKIELGDHYGMRDSHGSGVLNASNKEWYQQIAFYENFFKGKTVAEVKAWFTKYTDVNGRPYKFAYPTKMTDADKAATASFTDAEKKMLTDVTTGATMSLQDPHSRFIETLELAYELRQEIK